MYEDILFKMCYYNILTEGLTCTIEFYKFYKNAKIDKMLCCSVFLFSFSQQLKKINNALP